MKLNILKVIKALKKIKMLKVFKRTKASNISGQATSFWFKRSCAQSKRLVQTNLYQGVNQCQTTLLSEQLVGVSAAFSAAPSQSAPGSNAEHLPQKARLSAVFTVEPQLAQRLSKVDNVAQKLKPLTAMKRAKRGLSDHGLLIDYES